MARDVAPGTRRRMMLGLAVLGLFAVALTAGFAALRVAADKREQRLCDAINEPVAGLNGLRWDNAMTETGSSWVSVLTDGVENLAPSQQESVAEAVVADVSGWQRLIDELPVDQQERAEGLKALVVDPVPAAERREDPQVMAEVRALRRFASDRCGGLY